MNDEHVIPLHGDGLTPEQAQALDAQLAGLALDLTPPTDQWQAIDARLPPREPQRSVPHWQGFAMAASVATLAVLLGLALLDVGERSPRQDLVQDGRAHTPAPMPSANGTGAGEFTTASMDDASTRPAALPVSLGGRDALGTGFLEARARVSANFAERMATLDPATRTVVETNLTVIHEALGRIEQSLAADPNDTLLRELLMSTWRSELDYMGQVNRLPEPQDRRIEL